MIRIFCTKKLADMLPAAPERCTAEIAPLDKWCVNLTTLQRKKTVIAFCADTRFGFVLWGVKKAQFSNLPALVAEGIRKTFAFYGIRQEITDDYLAEPGVLCTGLSKADLGKINHLTVLINQLPHDLPISGPIPMEYAAIINGMIVRLKKSDYVIPLVRMLEVLKARYGMKPICRPAFELTATMNLEICVSRRTLLIPADYTFEDLHQALQVVFGWQDYHLYEFQVGDELLAMDDTDSLHPSTPASQLTLSDRLTVGADFLYSYDFGDGWEVFIHVDALRPDFDQPQPICTVAEGAAPPEDVGGVGGFIEFMAAYQDPNHPDHNDMRKWVNPLWQPEPNIRWMNAYLSR